MPLPYYFNCDDVAADKKTRSEALKPLIAEYEEIMAEERNKKMASSIERMMEKRVCQMVCLFSFLLILFQGKRKREGEVLIRAFKKSTRSESLTAFGERLCRENDLPAPECPPDEAAMYAHSESGTIGSCELSNLCLDMMSEKSGESEELELEDEQLDEFADLDKEERLAWEAM